jgi:transposase
MPRAAPGVGMKTGSGGVKLGNDAGRTEVDCSLWCFEPAEESDRDIAAYPRLLPPMGESTQSRLLLRFDVRRPSVAGDPIMDIVYACCAGLDVHKETVVATVRHRQADGRIQQQTRTYHTMTDQLLEMADWLQDQGVTHLAMESTGVYWKPIWNLMEDQFEIVLVNAQHIKHVPGRKTDVKDSEWIAQLLQCGLLRGSFVPEPPQRALRDLTRQRRRLTQAKAAVANRIQKVLEDANIKLGSVATDVLGVSGREMLRGLAAGESDPCRLAELARGRLRAKIPALRLALQGRVTEHHRFLLGLLLDELQHLEGLIDRLTQRIQETLPAPFAEAIERLKTIPGIEELAAQNIVAEIGVDMDVFPTPGHLASWAGLCPGQRESGGKRMSGRTRKGDQWLRTTLVQVAWAASHAKKTYLAAQYRRLVGRRGKKRALVAVAHTILVIIHRLLTERVGYQDLGGDYFDRLDTNRLTRTLVRRLERLGHEVVLRPKEPAA